MIHWILEKLFPPKCILCGRILERNEMDLCHHCRIHASEYSKGNLKLQFLDSWTAIWYYEENVRRSLLRYKFYNARSYATGYGRILAMKLLSEYSDGFDILTWIPISRLRRLRRGYDQVELLANAVSNVISDYRKAI